MTRVYFRKEYFGTVRVTFGGVRVGSIVRYKHGWIYSPIEYGAHFDPFVIKDRLEVQRDVRAYYEKEGV